MHVRVACGVHRGRHRRGVKVLEAGRGAATAAAAAAPSAAAGGGGGVGLGVGGGGALDGLAPGGAESRRGRRKRFPVLGPGVEGHEVEHEDALDRGAPVRLQHLMRGRGGGHHHRSKQRRLLSSQVRRRSRAALVICVRDSTRAQQPMMHHNRDQPASEVSAPPPNLVPELVQGALVRARPALGAALEFADLVEEQLQVAAARGAVRLHGARQTCGIQQT